MILKGLEVIEIKIKKYIHIKNLKYAKKCVKHERTDNNH